MLRDIPSEKIISLEKAHSMHWDVVIAGAGMGGSAAAWRLAREGMRVLLLEKGAANFDGSEASVAVEPESEEEQYNNGKWPTQVRAVVNGHRYDMWAPLGCGVGGSTLLYAAALQRLRIDDFDERPHPNGGTVKWPFSYRDLEPYYQQAEKLLSVCGTDDPLEPEVKTDLAHPPAMCEQDQVLFQSFKASGLHPFRIHVGILYKEGCGECGGHICKWRCKRDGYNSFIVPAVENENFYIAEYANVEKLHTQGTRVSAVEVSHDGKRYNVTADTVVLAAGGFFTPLILLRSHNERFANGLANKSGLVAKNLMFHATDFIGIWTKQPCSREGPKKTIAFRDLYRHNGQSYGECQSTGLPANYGLILFSLRLLFDQTPLAKLKPLRHLLRIPAFIASKLYGEASVFTTNVEDYPYLENRVVEDPEAPSGMRIEYTIHEELKERVLGMRNTVRARIKPLKSLLMNVKIGLNYGHPCGTARAGDDPETSVVDKNCKAHELDNLYIVDSSIMPTSGGTNPSLTIAANSLRVADHIAEKYRHKEQTIKMTETQS